jgi:hypothetical protein
LKTGDERRKKFHRALKRSARQSVGWLVKNQAALDDVQQQLPAEDSIRGFDGARLEARPMIAASKTAKTTRQLEILALRSFELADRVKAGELELLDGVDMALEAARWAGLTETVGDDIVQAVLAEAFANARPS